MDKVAVQEGRAVSEVQQEKPGSKLARIREHKGLTQEYVASKLHLRVQMVDYIERDEYQKMPEAVFIKGYLRAYARLLEVPSEPLLQAFHSLYDVEQKPEKALWQNKREFNTGERLVRWVSIFLVLTSLLVVGFWWQKMREHAAVSTDPVANVSKVEKKNKGERALLDLSKMASAGQSNTERHGAMLDSQPADA